MSASVQLLGSQERRSEVDTGRGGVFDVYLEHTLEDEAVGELHLIAAILVRGFTSTIRTTRSSA